MMLILAAALLLTTGSPHSSHSSGDVEFANDDLRRLGAFFGDCVVKKKHDLAREFVLEPVATVGDAVEYLKIAKQLSIGKCLLQPSSDFDRVSMRFGGDTMRHVLADALFKRDLASRPPLTNLDQIPQLSHGGFLSEFGQCVVRNDPQAAYALLQTSVVTPEEERAFAAIKPAMAACLTADTTIKLNKKLVRGLVAYSYVRLAWATPAAAPRSAGK